LATGLRGTDFRANREAPPRSGRHGKSAHGGAFWRVL